MPISQNDMSVFRRFLMMQGDVAKNYITFEDAEVGKICASAYGDGTGCTKKMLEAVTSVKENDGFKGNKSIKSFDEFEYFTGVTSIPQYIFSTSSLVKITFPKNIKSIANYWYRSNESNKDVRIKMMPATPPSVSWAFFNGVPKTAKFYVPDESVELYKSAGTWSSRADYIFPLSELVE